MSIEQESPNKVNKSVPQDQLRKYHTGFLWVPMAEVERILSETRVNGRTGKSMLYQRLRGMARELGQDQRTKKPKLDIDFLTELELLIGSDPQENAQKSLAERMSSVLSRVHSLRRDSIELAMTRSPSKPRYLELDQNMYTVIRSILHGVDIQPIDLSLQQRIGINQELTTNGFEPIDEEALYEN